MSLGEISYVAIVRVFMVEDHGDGLVMVSYDFGCVYMSRLVNSGLIVLDRFLGILHF